MKTSALTALLVAVLAVLAFGQADLPDHADPAVRFAAVDLFVDAGDKPLAAYQLEFKATAGQVTIVGIEGGQHAAFNAAPYHDPQAIQHERVILAAFSTAPAGTLPVGRTRVATIHVQITGDVEPRYAVKLTTSATVEGEEAEATISIEKGS